MSELHLHHLDNSRSFRILWLLEELDISYQLTKYQRTQSFVAPKSLEKIHPTGKSPILQVTGLDPIDPDKVLTLIESGHIIDFLMAKYDTEYKLHPEINADSQVWRDYDFWMHYCEGSAMPPLVMQLVFDKIVEKSPALIKPISRGIRKQVKVAIINKNITIVLSLIEKQLSANKWFAGTEFSAADMQMAFFVEAANTDHSLDPVRFTNTLNWLKRCKARPAYKVTVEKGGKLEF